MRTGWLAVNPNDAVQIFPLSDGGPGFVNCVIAATGAQRVACQIHDPLGRPIQAEYALQGDCAWIESAAACGLHLIESESRDPAVTTSYGVGELVSYAIRAGATRIVIGLGGSGTNDAGAGVLRALGATTIGGALDQGATSLGDISSVELTEALNATRDIDIILATDVDNPLLGARGATHTYAKQKGARDSQLDSMETAVAHFAALVGRREDGKDAAVSLGAGAAGGLGYALMHLGAHRVSGADYLAELLNVDRALASSDLVITGEGRVDDQTLHGKLAYRMAQLAVLHAKPCVVIGGEVRLGKRELAKNGFDAGYAMADYVGLDRAIQEPSESLAIMTERVARSWGRL